MAQKIINTKITWLTKYNEQMNDLLWHLKMVETHWSFTMDCTSLFFVPRLSYYSLYLTLTYNYTATFSNVFKS